MTLQSAHVGGIVRTIPNARKGLSVGAAGTTIDLTSVTADEGDATVTNLVNRWVILAARGGDITIMRGAAPGTAGTGFVIKSGEREEFFVEQGQSTTLGAKAGSSITLDILYDTQPVGQT